MSAFFISLKIFGGREGRRGLCGRLLAVGLGLLFATAVQAAAKRMYELPAGDAVRTLQLFSEQSGEQIVYPVDEVRGVKTNPVRGELTARDALDAMLARSGLIAVQDEANGALAVKRKTGAKPPPSAPRPRTAAVAPRASAAAVRAPTLVPDEMLRLSPFEVTAGAMQGYAAATSLAGNRLNTDLRDVGSAVSVVTSEFLRDAAATNNETLLQYTVSTEVGNIYGNMANAGSGTLLDETAKFLNPNQNTRVRGLGSADTTMDYFLTEIPWDSYNVDRIDFQRGPNAILFGLGSPAGIINAGAKVAKLANAGTAEARFGRFGSVRATLDLNQVLVPGQAALRVNTLSDHEKFRQEPAHQDDERLAGAFRFEPAVLNGGSARTSFKANFERGRVHSNRPRTTAPGDSITPWFLTGTAAGYDANGNPFQYRNPNRQGFDARGLQDATIASIGAEGRGEFVKNYNGSGGQPSGALNPYWQPWLGGQFAGSYFGNPMPIFASGDSTAFTMAAWEPGQSRGLGPSGAIDRGIGGIPFSRMSSLTLYRDISKKVNLPGAKFGLTRNLSLTDPSIIDFYNHLIDGPNKREWQNFWRYDLNLAQTFLDGRLGVEAVYDLQHYDNGQLIFMSDRGLQVYVDVIETEADGTANPNFGRPFIADSQAGGNSSTSDREAFRLTAYARHDFARGRRPSALTRLLGSHTLTGFYSDDTRENSTRSFTRYVADNAYKDFVNGYGSAPSNINSVVRSIYPVIYLGPSLKDATTAASAHIPTPTVEARVTSGTIHAFDSTWIATEVNPAAPWENPFYPVGHPNRESTQSENPDNYRGWIATPITVSDSEAGHRDENTVFASRGRTTTESKALNWQGNFWDGAFVFRYGYRTDRARAWAKSADRDAEGRAILDPATFKLPADSSRVEDGSSSWSAVLHLDRMLGGRLPLGVSFFYNRSQNFQPLAGRVGPLNNPLPPPTGRTKDFGLRLETRDGRYSLKINRYETSVVGANGTSGFNPFFLGQLFTEGESSRNKFVFEVADPARPETYHTGDPSQWNYQPKDGQTAEQARAAQQADIAGWDALVKSLPKAFFTAYRIDINKETLAKLGPITYQTPNGFTLPESNVAKGVEFEFYAQPCRGLRVTANSARSEAIRNDVGDPAFNGLVNTINTALNTTAAGSLRQDSGATAVTALERWNANFWAAWLSVKGQEGNAVPELRRWRANLIANYDFSAGWLKGVNVGAGYRWQDRVIIGYQPIYYIGDKLAPDPFVATSAKFDFDRPYRGPAEHNIDLWIGYSRRLSARLGWRTQLNVKNVGKGNSLIPITVQPDGTPAGLRIAPTMVWSLTNTIEF